MSENSPSAPALLVGSNIRKRRSDLGFSQKELAALCGVSPRVIFDWETGKKLPPGKRRPALERALKISFETLLDEHRAKKSSTQSLRGIGEVEDALLKLVVHAAELRVFRAAEIGKTQEGDLLEFRKAASQRILDHHLRVQSASFTSSPPRLKEIAWNMQAYGNEYEARGFFLQYEPAKSLDFYLFDKSDIVLLGYNFEVSPIGSICALWVSGDAVSDFFCPYWTSIWNGGFPIDLELTEEMETHIEVDMAYEKSELRQYLRPRERFRADRIWPRFVADAKLIRLEDGAPPLL